jgi:uroporphyrinogen decarboxylase
VMPFGTPDDVENEVKKRVADLAPGGGFVLTAVHNIQSGVKPENMIRLYESARKYGTYPIRV